VQEYIPIIKAKNIPESMATILQIANADRNLSLFSRGLKVSGLEEKLGEAGPFTILAPVNLALGKLTPSYEELLRPGSNERLVNFLSAYILAGKKMVHGFRNEGTLPTIDGNQVFIRIANGEIRVNGAKILARDKQGSNGVVHLLDKTYTL
jgi:uncharacterized surface protein with fasciclin (FAS1) repeats